MAEYLVKLNKRQNDEILDIVADHAAEGNQITAQDYINNIVIGVLNARMRNTFASYVQETAIDELVYRLGEAKEIRKSRKTKG